MKTKTLFLDRDGTINIDLQGRYVTKPNELILIEGVAHALVKAKKHGFKIAIITNQQGIGKNLYTVDDLNKIHEHLTNLIRQETLDFTFCFDAIEFSPDLEGVSPSTRKPSPVMVERAAKKLNSDLSNSFFIGDKDTDLLCAEFAKIDSILVLTGDGKKTLEKIKTWSNQKPIFIATDLAQAIDWCIQKKS
jgi:D-glycero-D-manno-heptose 1,7-bisphosphate phosphatase